MDNKRAEKTRASKGNMNEHKRNSFGILKPLVLASCLAVGSVSGAEGPINDWGTWKFKKVACLFSNTALVTMNGHTIPAFATNLFDDKIRLYLYGESDGKVFGVGNISLQSGDREAVLNVEAKGSLSTKGNNPQLSFTISGEGPGTVGTRPGEAQLNAKFVQTMFVTINPGLFEEHYAQGRITGTVKQPGGTPLKFEDNIRIRLDDIAGPGRAYITFDLVDIDGRRLSGHSHGTNNCFGRYEHSPVEMVASGTYREKTGEFSIETRGLGYTEDVIKGTVTGQLESAPSGSRIDISNVMLKGKAYGQKLLWNGFGAVASPLP